MRKGKFEVYPGVCNVFEYDPNAQITPHLKFDELDNPKSGEDIVLEVSQESLLAMQCWEYVRSRYGKGIKISSCYRTKKYNASIGGSANSFHLYGCAFDCQLGNVSDADYRQKWLKWVECACEKYGVKASLGRYPWGLHIGFMENPPYNIIGLVHEFDNR